MMDKKFFVALALSVVTVWGLQYYRGSKSPVPTQPCGTSVSTQPVTGQPIKAPSTQDFYRPLDLDIKFKEQFTEAEVKTVVQTDLYNASFSNHGAILSDIEFIKYKEGSGRALKSIGNGMQKGSTDKRICNEKCFMLALEKDSPLIYKLLYKREVPIGALSENNTQDVHYTEIAYQAETDFWAISKIYTLYKNSYRIDLMIKFEPKSLENELNSNAIRARIFLPSPNIAVIQENQTDIFVYNESKSAVDKIDVVATKDMFWYWSTDKSMVGAQDKYFVHALVEDSAKFVQRAYFKPGDDKNICVVLEGPEIKTAQSYKATFYIGPKILNDLASVDNRLVDLFSFGWLSWLCKLLLILLSFLVGYIKNYGLAIIALTVILRLPFIPLSIYGRSKMEEYQKYQPTIQRIRQKFKNDIQMQNQELMKFHKDHNLSTATPLLGCLPLLIQMPILFALYKVLSNYLELYQAPFVGWIVDLSVKDPYYILPIVMGLTMLWQQIIAPSTDEKQKIMMYFVSIVVTALFINFPAGLVLYWTTNNVITLIEDYFRRFVLR